ncbi:hypothetical protein B816_1977 [Weissella confusa]|uniref:DUF6508 domain-containing protein n=1 Tax=Weissella confusa TaxID=1583 RepID=UPI0022FEC8E5|nr:DUF6508 domain-containing protein [Weissella confusa]MDA5460460.1 hypothetical protein [Weissella confusa]
MAKEHPFDFKKWDAFLAEIEGKEIPWVMGAVADGHPQYDERMIELAKAFEWSDYFDRNFDRTLKQKGHQELPEEEVDEISRTSSDFRDLRAVTSVVIYGERRLEGMWAAMTEKGILRRLLKRLNDMTPDDFRGPNY